jgi:methionyl-tRNA formyltransferase
LLDWAPEPIRLQPGQIPSPEQLDLPRFGCLNVHAFLPLAARPNQAALLHGDTHWRRS